MSYREGLFKSAKTRKIMRKMIGKMYPKELLHLVQDRELKETDVPTWVERTLREECKTLIRRLGHYDGRIRDRFGFLGSVIEKLVIYPKIWTNWDGSEPFAWRDDHPIEDYFDSNQ